MTSTDRTAAQGMPWAIPLMFLLFLAGEFLALIHIGLVLAERGMTAFGIGLVSSALWAGILVACLRSARWAAQAGSATVLIRAAGLGAIVMALTALHDWYAVWILGAFVLGLTNGAIWVVGEAWLAQAASPERRGLLVGLFETAVGIGMLTGPLLLPVSLTLGIPPLGLAAALMGLGYIAALPLSAMPPVTPAAHHAASAGHAPVTVKAGAGVGVGVVGVAARTASAASASLPLIAIAGVAGLLESGSSALFPPLSTKLGFSVGEAAALGAVVGAGSALMQAPFGILADRVGVGRALLAAWTILVVATGALALQSAAPQGMLWPVAFAMGGVGGAVYTLIVIALGNRLTGGALIQAMGWLVVAYALGSVSGPLIGGAIFDLSGFPALALTFVGACIVGLLASLRTIRRLGRI